MTNRLIDAFCDGLTPTNQSEKGKNMKKISNLLEDYAANLKQIETLKKERAAAVQAAASGKADSKAITKIRDLDIKREIAAASLGNIRQLIIDQIKPEYLDRKNRLSAELSELMAAKQHRYHDYLEYMAAAMVCRESITGQGRFDVTPNGDIKENALPAMAEPFLPGSSLDIDERQLYAAAVQDERKKYANEPFDRRAGEIRAEIAKIDSVLGSDPAEFAETLIKKGEK